MLGCPLGPRAGLVHPVTATRTHPVQKPPGYPSPPTTVPPPGRFSTAATFLPATHEVPHDGDILLQLPGCLSPTSARASQRIPGTLAASALHTGISQLPAALGHTWPAPCRTSSATPPLLPSTRADDLAAPGCSRPRLAYSLSHLFDNPAATALHTGIPQLHGYSAPRSNRPSLHHFGLSAALPSPQAPSPSDPAPASRTR